MEPQMIYCLAVLAATFLVICKLSTRPRNSEKVVKAPPPPSPPALPIIGHLHLVQMPYHRSLQSLSAKYGPIIYLRLGRRRLIVVSSPQATEECFTKSNDVVFANRPDFLTGQILGYNYSNLVWAPYGDHWRNLRRVSTLEAFSSHRLRKSSWLRVEEVRHFARELHRSSTDPTGVGLVEINMNRALFLLTRNIVMRMVSGKRWVSGPADELFVSKTGFMTVCDFFPVLRWIGYKGLETKMVELSKCRDRLLQGLIDEARAKKPDELEGEDKGEESKKAKSTIVEELVALQRNEPDYYTDDVLKGILLLMFTAGTETSARTMEWAMSLLLNHPTAFQNARDEIDARIAHQSRLVDDSDLPSLPYLQCIVNETLRLFPATPLLVPHFSSSDITICGYHVPRGTILLANAWAMHRDPKVWDDPLMFRPERFINQLVDGEKNRFRYIPFGVGRRACPGSNMGMRIVILAIATMIQCFDWERVEIGGSVDLEEKGIGVTVLKNEPLHAICKTRPCIARVLSEL